MAMRRAAQQAARFAMGPHVPHIAPAARSLHASAGSKKIVGVFYKGGEYADRNPNFVGCAEHALGIRGWLESQGHQYIVTDDKDGPNCELEKHIADAHVLITTPFHPAYVTADRIARAKNLELLLTAGIGSDHVDLPAAAAAGLTVAEVTGSNTVSVAEDQLMRVLVLVRNFLPGHHQAISGEWDVAGVAHRAYDLEGKTVGTVGAGRIGRLLLQRLRPFNCRLLYHDRLRIDPALEAETGAQFEAELDAMLPKCDVVVLNMPLTEKTRGMFEKERIARMKKGVIIVNNARGAIMDMQAVADACATGHIAGYGGDVWHPQPAPKDHPWRYMPNNAMTPHISGTTIDGQLRYAAGVKDMLERYFQGQDFPVQNYIVKEGKLAGQYQ
ncbi:formate dehydrogenase 2, mitochondrial-like [Miscanthus floridulus]|uniref:formate dehydrogenase 2, mitochondrial-like n=1 Tax=Miscanthus floridulus TaxID=154761 RepID=UPI0034596187